MITFRVVVPGLEDLSERYPGLDGALVAAHLTIENGLPATIHVMQRGKVKRILTSEDIRKAHAERRSQLVF